jgi:hypothetical protein
MLIQKTSQNTEDVEQLTRQVTGLNTFLGNAKTGGAFPQAVTERIGRLSIGFVLFDMCSRSTLSKVSEELESMASRHVISRFIHCDDDVLLISGHIQTITWSIQSFMVCLLIFSAVFLNEPHAGGNHTCNRICT